ncbi:MAG: MarR family winged helix-turn-helix transcriptional regulator [Acidimicrobiales bacterium]
MPKAPTRTTADPSLQLAELLGHAARRLRRGSNTQLAPLGLTMAQARVLRIVAAAEPPLHMADIATQLEVVPRTVTPMVDGLESAALVTRRSDPEDRRSVLVELTAEGRRLLQSLDRARRATADEIFGPLSAAQRSDLLALLARLCAGGSCHSCAAKPGDRRRRSNGGS